VVVEPHGGTELTHPALLKVHVEQAAVTVQEYRLGYCFSAAPLQS
jgi:hypothetical protein